MGVCGIKRVMGVLSKCVCYVGGVGVQEWGGGGYY